MSPYIRLFNGSDHNINLYKSGFLTFANLKPYCFTPYIKVCPGTQILEIAQNNIRQNIELKFAPEDVYCLCAVKNNNSYRIIPVNEPSCNKPEQYGYVRFINISSKFSQADIYANSECIISGINIGDISKYIAILPGIYRFSAKNANKGIKSKFPIQNLNIEPGKYHSLYITDHVNSSIAITPTTDAANHKGFIL